MKKYFLMTPKIAARLRGTVFNGMSSAIYGEAGGRIRREDEFAEVRTSLVHLLRNVHYEPTVRLASKVTAIKEAYERLMKHGADRFSSEKRTELDRLISEIMSLSRQQLNDTFTEDHISRFAQLARQGREYFEAEGYDPEAFVSEELLVLAEIIAANFEAYEATLNTKYVD